MFNFELQNNRTPHLRISFRTFLILPIICAFAFAQSKHPKVIGLCDTLADIIIENVSFPITNCATIDSTVMYDYNTLDGGTSFVKDLERCKQICNLDSASFYSLYPDIREEILKNLTSKFQVIIVQSSQLNLSGSFIIFGIYRGSHFKLSLQVSISHYCDGRMYGGMIYDFSLQKNDDSSYSILPRKLGGYFN